MKGRRKGSQRKAGKLCPSARPSKNKFVPPQTLEEFFAMSELDQDLWQNIDQAVTEVRAGASLRQASRKFDLDPRKVPQLAQPALRKLRNGRWAARTHDRLLRVLVVPTREGLQEIGVPDSRQASLLGKYWNSVQRYLETGDAFRLEEFKGKQIRSADGTTTPLLTDLSELDRLGSAGLLSFQSIYGRTA